MTEQLKLKLLKEKRKGKSIDRSVYIALTDSMSWTLCGFCRYNSGGCDSSVCKHPLDNHIDFQDRIDVGHDCWGFKPIPKYSIEEFADIAGTYLEQGWEVCLFSKNDDGMIAIQGSKDWF